MSNRECVQGQGGQSEAPTSALSPAQGSEALEASRGCVFSMDLGRLMAYRSRNVQASP